MRLDRFLAHAGKGTRSSVKGDIRKGIVTVNGAVVKKPEFQVDEEADEIRFGDTKIQYRKFVYYMLNKPAGFVSAVKDSHDRTVMELLDNVSTDGLFPVGRLDKDTEGLLLITNDGALAHELLSPAKHVPKTYYAELDGKLTEDDANRFLEGLDIGEKRITKPARLEILTPKTKAYVTVSEGKFHQIKRMFHVLGYKVLYLKRISMGTLALDLSLGTGEFRALTETEIEQLRSMKENASDYHYGK